MCLRTCVPFWCPVMGSALSEQVEICFGNRVPEENSSWQLQGKIQTHIRWKAAAWDVFFNTRRRKKEKEYYLLRVPDERNGWHEEETNKNEGGNSRLTPQAGQIQDSVAAGSSLRQDNRADGCMEKIRSVKSTVHPRIYAAGSCRKSCLFVLFFTSANHDSHSSPGTSSRPPCTNDQTMPVHTLSSEAPWNFLLSQYFFPNFAHWRDTGNQPPMQANTLQLEKIWRDIRMFLKISPCEGPYIQMKKNQ